jgi:uncharacterized protein YneF (UPF0154 family)
MNLTLAILLIIVAALAGFAGGLFLMRKQFEKQMLDNPPMTDEAIRMIMASAGRVPSEAQVQKMIRSIKAAAKQANTK